VARDGVRGGEGASVAATEDTSGEANDTASGTADGSRCASSRAIFRD
jgi:hypothetical protein